MDGIHSRPVATRSIKSWTASSSKLWKELTSALTICSASSRHDTVLLLVEPRRVSSERTRLLQRCCNTIRPHDHPRLVRKHHCFQKRVLTRFNLDHRKKQLLQAFSAHYHAAERRFYSSQRHQHDDFRSSCVCIPAFPLIQGRWQWHESQSQLRGWSIGCQEPGLGCVAILPARLSL